MSAWLATHGAELALATSAVLAVGALAVRSTRSPHLRHRTAELTLVVAFLAGVAVLVPMPRPSWLPAPEPPPIEVATTVEPEVWRPIPPVQVPSDGTILLDRPVTVADAAPIVTSPVETFRDPIGLTPFFLAGALLLCLHGLIASVLLQRLLRRARPAPEWTQGLIEGNDLRVLVSDDARRPFCCGLRRGTIVLPRALVRREWSGRLEAVLRHERAHLDQRHPRARVLAAALAPLLYWQPLYWWLSRDLRRSAELLADDMATRDFDKRRYVQALLDLADHARRTRLAESHGVGAWNAPKDFLERMEKLIMRTRPFATRLTPIQFLTRTGCALVLVSSVSLAWGPVVQDAETTSAATPFLADVPLLSELFDGECEETISPSETPVDDPIAATHDPFDPIDPRGNRPAAQEPTHKVLLQFIVQDAAQLGTLLMALGDARVELSTESPGARRVRAEVDGMTDEALMAFTQIDGLVLESIAVGGRGPWDPVSNRGSNPVKKPSAVTEQPRTGPITTSRRGPATAASPFLGSRRGWTTGATTDEDLRKRLDQVEQQLADLSALLVEIRRTNAVNGHGPVEKKVTTMLRGHVLDVTAEGIALSLGSNHGVRPGMSFEVYNGNLYKGRVIVTQVSEEICTSKLSQKVDGRAIVAGDSVTDRL